VPSRRGQKVRGKAKRTRVSVHRDGHDRANLEAASVILADPERYGGEGSLLVRWARVVIERETAKKAKEAKKGYAETLES